MISHSKFTTWRHRGARTLRVRKMKTDSVICSELKKKKRPCRLCIGHGIHTHVVNITYVYIAVDM